MATGTGHLGGMTVRRGNGTASRNRSTSRAPPTTAVRHGSIVTSAARTSMAARCGNCCQQNHIGVGGRTAAARGDGDWPPPIPSVVHAVTDHGDHAPRCCVPDRSSLSQARSRRAFNAQLSATAPRGRFMIAGRYDRPARLTRRSATRAAAAVTSTGACRVSCRRAAPRIAAPPELLACQVRRATGRPRCKPEY
jgi:hypothetical protein